MNNSFRVWCEDNKEWEKDEFECQYNISGSMNMLKSPNCGSVMNDEHFDRIVCGFESEAKWLSRLSE